MRVIYFLRKLFISFEFLLILLFYILRLEFESFKILNKFLIENSISIISFTLAPYSFLIWKSYFPDKDTNNVLKNFDKKKDLYLTNAISIFYFLIFALLLLLAKVFEASGVLIFNKNLAILAVAGLIIVLLSIAVNVLMLNLIFRDHT